MKLLIIDPPHLVWGVFKGWIPSTANLALMAYLERENIEFEHFDGTLAERPWHDLEAAIRRIRPDLVTLTMHCTYFAPDAMNTARLIKAVHPACKIIIGGAHPSGIPHETFAECPQFDYICLGEGEVTLAEFARAFARGDEDFADIRGLAYIRPDGQFVATEPRPMIDDLDTLPVPAYHRIDMEHPYNGLPSEGARAWCLSFARGCNFRCTFCSEAVHWGGRWRGRSPEKIVDEIELLYEKYRRDTFFVGDDVFNMTRARTEGFIAELRRRNLAGKCHYWVQSRADIIVRDADLLDDLREVGVYQIMLGVEYHRDATLQGLNKRATVDQNRKAMQLVKKHKLMLLATLLIGHWDETAADRDALMKFTRPYVDHFGLNVATPYPGTPYYAEMKRLGRIAVTDWSKYDQLQAVMPTAAEPDPAQITRAHQDMMRRFYWRPKELLRMLFSPNPILRRHHRHFMKYGLEIALHEILGRPMWTQSNFQLFEDYLTETGRTTDSLLKSCPARAIAEKQTA